jgi:hypothetical protein
MAPAILREIDRLTARNRARRDPSIEARLVELRREGGRRALASSAAPPGACHACGRGAPAAPPPPSSLPRRSPPLGCARAIVTHGSLLRRRLVAEPGVTQLAADIAAAFDAHDGHGAGRGRARAIPCGTGTVRSWVATSTVSTSGSRCRLRGRDAPGLDLVGRGSRRRTFLDRPFSSSYTRLRREAAGREAGGREAGTGAASDKADSLNVGLCAAYARCLARSLRQWWCTRYAVAEVVSATRIVERIHRRSHRPLACESAFHCP